MTLSFKGIYWIVKLQNIGVRLGFTPDEQQDGYLYRTGSDNQMSSQRRIKGSIIKINHV